jgi:hypothetical protein
MDIVNDAQSWFRAVKNSCFGLILPNGWFGRPYDNQHVLTKYCVENEGIYIKFDDGMEISISDPKNVVVRKDSGGTVLTIGEFKEVKFKFVPYGETEPKENYMIFHEGELSLVGYYI